MFKFKGILKQTQYSPDGNYYDATVNGNPIACKTKELILVGKNPDELMKKVKLGEFEKFVIDKANDV